MIRIWSVALLVVVAALPERAITDSAMLQHALADKILVDKSDHKLMLLKEGTVLRSFNVSLGLSPKGPKRREGDFKTPEGVYSLEAKNENSDFFLSIKISYPDHNDRRTAAHLGVQPGGQIMIHGQPNEPKHPATSYKGRDWTDGCIAVSNGDMVDIWLMTAVGTTIEIQP
jgi:murein L,D-transpeptidase YafK